MVTSAHELEIYVNDRDCRATTPRVDNLVNPSSFPHKYTHQLRTTTIMCITSDRVTIKLDRIRELLN